MSTLAPSGTIGAPSASQASGPAAMDRSLGRSRFAGKRVHFVGIGGCGMSGLARILLDADADISGSDPSLNEQTAALARQGAVVSRAQDGELLGPDTDLVVRTAAVKDDNQEIRQAHDMGLPVILYAELLGQVMAERTGVAVAGTHGKSTTTAMLAYALTRCGADPSFVVGGTVPQLGGGSHSGTGSAFVAEACEFNRSFLSLSPKIAIVTNIEADHLDCYKDLDDIIRTFGQFADRLPPDGLLIANGDDPNSGKVIAHARKAGRRVETVGRGLGCDWTIVPAGLENGCGVAHLLHNAQQACTLRLNVPGQHNITNASMAVAAAVACGCDARAVAEALADFTGVDRRMMQMGEINGAPIVDDYGHHPTEIRATLAALRERYQPRRLICVFQPHQASRTRHLLDDFATSFAAADVVILPDIYTVRDTVDDQKAVSSSELATRIRAAGKSAEHIPTFERVADRVRAEARVGDLIVTMGAGPVWKVGKMLVENAEG